MHKNILIIKSNHPLEVSRRFDEPKYLTSLFKGKGSVKVGSSGTSLYIYDIDPSLLNKCDSVFQKFRNDAIYESESERRRILEKIIFEKGYFEIKPI